mgnify:CR=1 FL=1
MTTIQQTKADHLRAHRAKVKLRQRHAVTAAAYNRSEWARKLRYNGGRKPMPWKIVADKLGVKTCFVARQIAMRNPKR